MANQFSKGGNHCGPTFACEALTATVVSEMPSFRGRASHLFFEEFEARYIAGRTASLQRDDSADALPRTMKQLYESRNALEMILKELNQVIQIFCGANSHLIDRARCKLGILS